MKGSWITVVYQMTPGTVRSPLFIGGVKVCLMIRMLVNCTREVKRGPCLSDRPRDNNCSAQLCCASWWRSSESKHWAVRGTWVQEIYCLRFSYNEHPLVDSGDIYIFIFLIFWFSTNPMKRKDQNQPKSNISYLICAIEKQLKHINEWSVSFIEDTHCSLFCIYPTYTTDQY